MPRVRRVTTIVALVCAGFAWVATAATQAAPPAQLPQLYFVGVGGTPSELLEYLVAHFQRTIKVDIKVLQPMSIDSLARDRERGQVVAEGVIRSMRQQQATLARDLRSRVIGITPEDMFIQRVQNQWIFAFSLRDPQQQFAVVSYARMYIPNTANAPPDEMLMRSRLRKMVTKNIGLIYYGLPVSDDPTSVMYRNILGIDDLDRMAEYFR